MTDTKMLKEMPKRIPADAICIVRCVSSGTMTVKTKKSCRMN